MTRSSAIAQRPRDASCQLKSCQLPRNSAVRQQQQQRPFNGLWSGTTRVGRYQKEHSPTYTHPDHRSSFIIFLHLQRSMASSLFNLRAWQSSRTTSFQVFFGLPLGGDMHQIPFIATAYKCIRLWNLIYLCRQQVTYQKLNLAKQNEQEMRQTNFDQAKFLINWRQTSSDTCSL